jgi:hypothetical protein
MEKDLATLLVLFSFQLIFFLHQFPECLEAELKDLQTQNSTIGTRFEL